MLPRVGIVLINYKDYARRFLADCRDSFRALDYPKDRFVVYIVDNATSPETQAHLRVVYPEAIVLPESANAGWGGGNNVGISQAFRDGCDDVLLSNMDVIAEPGWLRELVTAAHADPRIGIVQSKLLLHPSGRVNSVGNVLHFLGFGFCDGYGEVARRNLPVPPGDPLPPPRSLASSSLGVGQSPSTREFAVGFARRSEDGDDDRVRDIGYASGASMYVKGIVLRRIGLCNPEFFMYHDDVELCLKAKLVGFRVVLAPRSVLWHKYEFKRSVLQVYSMERNRLLTVLQFYRIPTLLLLAPAFVLMELGVLLGGILGGYARPKLRGWAYLLRPSSWRRIARERRRIQVTRQIGDRQLLADSTGRILFQEVQNPLLAYVANPMLAGYWWAARRLIWW